MRVGGLAREHGGVVGAADGGPQQPVLDDVTRVVFVLFVYQHAIDQPADRGLWATCGGRWVGKYEVRLENMSLRALANLGKNFIFFARI